jgi:hypothetical protein
LRNLDLGREVGHVMRAFRAYELATTSLAVRISWEKTGFGFEQRDGTWYLYTNETKIRTSPEFAEVWALNNPEESLSVRKRQQVWGWISQQFFRVKYQKPCVSNIKSPQIAFSQCFDRMAAIDSRGIPTMGTIA